MSYATCTVEEDTSQFQGSRATNIAYIRNARAAHRANLTALSSTLQEVIDVNKELGTSLRDLQAKHRREHPDTIDKPAEEEMHGSYLLLKRASFGQVADAIQQNIGSVASILGLIVQDIQAQLELTNQQPNGLAPGRNKIRDMKAIWQSLKDFHRRVEILQWPRIMKSWAKLPILAPHNSIYVSAAKKYSKYIKQLANLLPKDGTGLPWNMYIAVRVVEERRLQRVRDKRQKRRQRAWEDEQILTKLWPVS